MFFPLWKWYFHFEIDAIPRSCIFFFLKQASTIRNCTTNLQFQMKLILRYTWRVHFIRENVWIHSSNSFSLHNLDKSRTIATATRSIAITLRQRESRELTIRFAGCLSCGSPEVTRVISLVASEKMFRLRAVSCEFLRASSNSEISQPAS